MVLSKYIHNVDWYAVCGYDIAPSSKRVGVFSFVTAFKDSGGTTNP